MIRRTSFSAFSPVTRVLPLTIARAGFSREYRLSGGPEADTGAILLPREDSEFPVSLAACTAPAGGAVLMDLAKPGAGAQQQRAKAIRPHLSRFIGPAYLPLKGWPSFG